ncbi:MAG: sugar phosphate isomerase/epimerase [Acidobacteria bacterium]|nr:sugar phosphate isomerase/epimerase [Acidobacteriota bacterium]
MPSRRDFLATTALLPTLPLDSFNPQQAARSRRRGPKIGTVTYNIAKDWDIEAIIKNLTEVGMEGVELRTTHRHGVEIALTPGQRAEVRKRFDDSPVKIAGLGTVCEYQSADPASVRRNIEETKRWCQLARDVGSPGVKVRPNGLPKEVPEEKTLAQIGRALKECGDVARDQGVLIQLEVHGEGTSRLPRIRRMLDQAGNHPAVKVCWNSNQTDLLDGGFESNFRLVRDQIGQVHMRDLFLEEYPWRDLIRALHEIDFQGFCFAEIPESADPVRVLKYFRRLFLAFVT